MKEHIELGKTGENQAVGYLCRKGYQVIDRNWRLGHHEIDLVAMDGGTVVIVEVKTRNSGSYCDPGQAVGPLKQKILVYAANAWTRFHSYEGEVRFDVVTILMVKGEKPLIRHIKDAFYPW
ncbi:MAG: YraN family protein [Bacteroidales bacterium]|nr:YraN family protein [Bacteroidales bacterium]